MKKCHIELKKQIWGDKYIEICLVILHISDINYFLTQWTYLCISDIKYFLTQWTYLHISDIKYFLTQWTIFKNKVPQEVV